MSERKRRAKEWARYVVACAAILLVAWGVAMVVVMTFTKAWVNDPFPKVTDIQRKIAVETMEELRRE